MQFKNTMAQFIDELLKAHAKVLRKNPKLVTSLEAYFEGAFQTINKALQHQTALSEADADIVHEFDMTFRAIDPTRETMTLYKAVHSKQNPIPNNSFLTGVPRLEDVKREFDTPEYTIYEINVPSGSSVLTIESGALTGFEATKCLLDRRGTYMVTHEIPGVDGGADTRSLVYLPLTAVNLEIRDFGELGQHK